MQSIILQYREFKGRSYHSAVHDSDYFLPIDDRMLDNLDLMHHFLTLLTDDKLHLAPIKPDATKVLDVGTGTGMHRQIYVALPTAAADMSARSQVYGPCVFAIAFQLCIPHSTDSQSHSDFADEHPGIHVVGTDLSPVQPNWVPSNLSFEIHDCTNEWTWDADTFDFVHIRYLIGSIRDWTTLYEEAYRVLQPGAYLESVETEATYFSDDGTVANDGATLLGGKFGEMFAEAGRITGNSMTVITNGTQVKAMTEAGFVDIREVTYKVSSPSPCSTRSNASPHRRHLVLTIQQLPMGPWPRDRRLALIGAFARQSLLQDLTGYLQLTWHQVLKWPPEEFENFLLQVRQELQNRRLHPYVKVRFVWGHKPDKP